MCRQVKERPCTSLRWLAELLGVQLCWEDRRWAAACFEEVRQAYGVEHQGCVTAALGSGEERGQSLLRFVPRAADGLMPLLALERFRKLRPIGKI